MSINPDLILNRCEEIAESLARLENIKKTGKEEFLQDQDLMDIACYRLLLAIEAALNMCYHVCAKQLKKIPREYAECFQILAEQNTIPRELGDELMKMARFRNMLVHAYWKMNIEMIYDIIQNDLDHLRDFSGHMADLIETPRTG